MKNSESAHNPHTVDLVIYPGFKALEAIGTMSVFEYANVHLERAGRPVGYEVSLISTIVGEIKSDMQMSLRSSRTVDAHWSADTSIVVGARDIDAALKNNEELIVWLEQIGANGSRLVGLCSGSFFLAAAKLLDGKQATTHWSVANSLREKFEKVDVQPDAIYLHAGQLWTSAGVTACIDLALALVEEDFGRALALQVARDLVVYLKRPGGQSQFSLHLASQSTANRGIREAQEWILSNMDKPILMCELARNAAMSERNFRRVFFKEVGSTPVTFIENARIESARRMLEDGELPLKSIARMVGYSSERSLRHLLIKRLGITPDDYRARFGRG